MRFSVLSLLLPVVLGCAGKNVVAGDDKTKSQQLEAAVPSWCDTTCKRLQACPATPCSCTGDLCDCPATVDSGCPAQCLEAMAHFTSGDDACAIAGEHFRQCVDAASCSAIENGACQPSDADQAACPEVNGDGSGDPTGDAPTGPNGASGGSSSIDSPPVGGVLIAAPVGCTGTWTTVRPSSGGAPPSSAVVCEEGLDGCSDGHEYSWLCANGSQGETACSCLVDQQVTGGFDPGGTSCPTQPQINAGCKWNIAN